MSDKARIHSRLNAANNLEFFDQSTHERVFALAALFYEDDFLSAAGNITNGRIDLYVGPG